MRLAHRKPARAATIGSRRFVAAWIRFGTVWLVIMMLGGACGKSQPPEVKEESETVARTEFTERIENFFEYEPLVPAKPSRFLIHLTDLTDGAPVEKAEVTLAVRQAGGGPVTEAKARVGKVTGIYVAEVTVPAAGAYDIEFRVRNVRLDERMPLTDFKTP
jgi:hypothetical protein